VVSIESQEVVRNGAVHVFLQTRGPVESEVGEFKVEKNFTPQVFNNQRYPLLQQSFDSLQVPKQSHLLITISWDVEQHIAIPTRDIRDVAVVRQRLHDRFGGFNLPEGDERVSRFVQRTGDGRCCFCFALCADNRRLPFLFGLEKW